MNKIIMTVTLVLASFTCATLALAQTAPYSTYGEEPTVDSGYDQVPPAGERPVGEEDLDPAGTEPSSPPIGGEKLASTAGTEAPYYKDYRFWYVLRLPTGFLADMALAWLADMEGSNPDLGELFKLLRDVVSFLAYASGFLFYVFSSWVAWKAYKAARSKNGGHKAITSHSHDLSQETGKKSGSKKTGSKKK